MNQAAMIVSIIAVLGALVLVTSSSNFKRLPFSRKAQLAVVWALIIAGLAFVLNIFGVR